MGSTKTDCSHYGFSLLEVIIGLTLMALISAGGLTALGYFQGAIQTQHDLARATELADRHFKQIRLMEYSEVLTLLGIDATQNTTSDPVTLENTADGFTVVAESKPNTD